MTKLLLFIFLTSASLSKAQSMAAGQWNAQASFKLNGIPMPPSHSTECLTAAEAKDAKATIEKSLKHNNCQLNSWSIKKSQLKADVACKNADYDAKGQLSGLFDRQSYDLSGEISGTHKVFGKAYASVQFSGRWMGKCQKK